MSDAAELIAQLEALADALPNDPSLEVISRYVEARSPIASRLATLAESEGTTRERIELARRLERVLERDRPLLAALFSARDTIGDRLRGLSQARTAARGYGGRGESARRMRKTA